MHFVVYILAFCDILNSIICHHPHHRTVRIYIGSAQCVGQNTWLYLQTVLFLCSFILFDKSGLETRVCCKKAFVLFSERAHTRDSTRVATRVHLTIIGVCICSCLIYKLLCVSYTLYQTISYLQYALDFSV